MYEICPVCCWEYDPIQNDNPNYSGGANSISLFDAIHNYQKYGAISKEYNNRHKTKKSFLLFKVFKNKVIEIRGIPCGMPLSRA